VSGCKKDNTASNNQQTTAVAGQTSSANDSGSDFNNRPSDAPRINVQLVEQALSQVQQTDPNGWVQDFEKRVNEIYDGDEVVSIDAHPDASNNLQIIGYISHSGQQGYQAASDDQLFDIVQTGAVANNQTPYRMTYTTSGGSAAYYDGYYTNPYLMGWYGNAIMYHSWGGYYTSPTQIVVIHSYRTTYRTTPAYVQQRAYTHQYYTQTYHGAPVTVRPGTSIGAGVTVRPGAPAPAHVSQPATFTPSKAVAPTTTFNRPSVGTPSAITPPKAVAPTTTFNRPAASPPALQNRPGGLFNSHTFGGSAAPPRSFSAPSRSFSSGSHHR
jgi:hypothetical protein